MRAFLLFLLCMLPATRTAAAPAENAPGAAVSGTDIERPLAIAAAANEDLAFVRHRGVDLYERHQATLLALDAAREIDLGSMPSEGWITVRESEGLRVRFVGACEEGPCAILDVLIDSERLSARSVFPPEVLGGDELRAWRARSLAFEELTATCEVPYNAVAIPPDGGEGQWTVYLVPQPADAEVVAVGGHMRAFLDPDAREILRAEDFSAGCLLLQRTPEQKQLAIDYARAPLPAETHVLNSLLHGLVLFVGARRGVYRVNGDQVERLRAAEAASP